MGGEIVSATEIFISIFVAIFVIGAIYLVNKTTKELAKYEKEHKNDK